MRQSGAAHDTQDAADWAQALDAVAQRQDRAAFARLFAHFAPRVKALATRLGSRIDGEELAQDVMLTVWRRAATFDPVQASVATWIFTIARNRRIDLLRKAGRAEIDLNDPALVPAGEPPAEEVVARNAWRTRLGGLIAALPEEQRALLRRSFFEDKSHGEIARELGLPLGTVKSRLRMALGRIRQSLGNGEER